MGVGGTDVEGLYNGNRMAMADANMQREKAMMRAHLKFLTSASESAEVVESAAKFKVGLAWLAFRHCSHRQILLRPPHQQATGCRLPPTPYTVLRRGYKPTRP